MHFFKFVFQVKYLLHDINATKFEKLHCDGEGMIVMNLYCFPSYEERNIFCIHMYPGMSVDIKEEFLPVYVPRCPYLYL